MYFEPVQADRAGRHAKPSSRSTSLLIYGLNYAPELIGIGPYTAGLAQGMAGRGHRVRAIVGHAYYPKWRCESPGASAWIHGREGGVEVTRCPLYVPRRPTTFSRLRHYASFALSSFVPMVRALRAERPDAIVAIAPSLLVCLGALLLGKLFRVPVWLHMQDFEVELAFATGFLRPTGLAARLAFAIERFVLRRASRISSISPRMCERLADKGVPASRIVLLRNWANHAEGIAAAGEAGQKLRQQWGLERSTIALYSGNIAAKQGLDSVISAARALRHRRDLTFVISGDGPNKVDLERKAADLPNVVFKPLQEPPRFAAMMRAADIHLLPQLAGTADLVLPSKLPNMLASGRPVVAIAAAGTNLAGEVLGCGIVVSPAQRGGMARALEQLLDDRELAAAFGVQAERRAAAHWSKRQVVDRFERCLRSMMESDDQAFKPASMAAIPSR